MSFPLKKKGKQGTWGKALLLFIAPMLIIFCFRWLVVEPFVIPSESMTPNLLVHDHILVTKWSYGIKSPLGDGWLFKFKKPQRGEIVVFRYPKNRDVFFIKRLIGLPGDRIRVQNGQIIVNDKPWVIEPMEEELYIDEDDFSYFREVLPADETSVRSAHIIKLLRESQHVDPNEKEFVVPEHSYFMMGDNRDQSHDSRFWGFVDEKYIVGHAAFIWLSCVETMATAPMICDPLKLRFERLFKKVEE